MSVRHLPAILPAVLVVLSACRPGASPVDQSDPSSSSPGTDSTQHEGSAGEPAASYDPRPRIRSAKTCAPEATVVDEAGVCIVLPPGYVGGRAHAGTQTFEHAEAPPITLRWDKVSAGSAQAHAKAIARLGELDPEAIVAETSDGHGTFAYAVETQAGDHRVTHTASSLRTGEHEVWCSASVPTTAKAPRAFFEACQTVLAVP